MTWFLKFAYYMMTFLAALVLLGGATMMVWNNRQEYIDHMPKIQVKTNCPADCKNGCECCPNKCQGKFP